MSTTKLRLKKCQQFFSCVFAIFFYLKKRKIKTYRNERILLFASPIVLSWCVQFKCCFFLQRIVGWTETFLFFGCSQRMSIIWTHLKLYETLNLRESLVNMEEDNSSLINEFIVTIKRKFTAWKAARAFNFDLLANCLTKNRCYKFWFNDSFSF